MSSATTQPSRPWRTLLVVLLLASPLIGVAAYRASAWRNGTSDFDDFHETVRQGLFAATRPTMSPEWGAFNYHPFLMVVMAPFGLLPMWLACAVFLTLSIALLAVAVRAALLRLWPDAARDRQFVGITSLALAAPYLVSSILLGQFECLLLAVLVLAWLQLERRRDWTAGLLIAGAALLKAYPGLLILWLLAKRRWSAVGGVLLGFVLGAGVLPSLLFGVGENARLHREWFERVVVDHSALRELVKTENVMWRYKIETLPITLRRYLTPYPYSDRDRTATINFASLPTEPITLGPWHAAPLQIIYVLIAGSALAAMGLVIRHRDQILSVERRRYEFAFVTLMALLLSPVIWASRYFALAWFGLALLCGALRTASQHGTRVWFARCVALLWLISLALWTETLRAWSVHYWAAVVLTVWLGVSAARCRPQRSSPIASDQP